MRVPCAGSPYIVARALAVCCAAASLMVLMPAWAQETPAGTDAAVRPSFDELYRRGQQASEGIETLTARFTETTSPALLERPLVARGKLFVERTVPARVALHYSDPEERKVLIDGNRMTTVWPSRGLHESSDVRRAQANVQRYFVARDAGELRRLFDIEVRDVSSRPGTHEVSMVPRRREIGETLASLDLWVDESTGLLTAMRMTFSNQDTKLMEFDEVSPDAAIDPAVFLAGN